MKKSSRGLDEMFDKVFAADAMQSALGSLHTEFPNGGEKPQSTSASTEIVTPRLLENETFLKDSLPTNNPTNNSVYPAKSSAKPDKPGVNPAKHPAKSKERLKANVPANNQTNNQANNQTNNQTNALNTECDFSQWYPLTINHSKVLVYLLNANGKTNRNEIADRTGVNIATVKYCLRVFAKEGYVTDVRMFSEHTYKGFYYSINYSKINELKSRNSQAYPANRPANHQAHYPANIQDNSPVNHQANDLANQAVSYSSSLESKTTTLENHNIEHLLKTDPELGYWQEKGLTPKQVEKWMEDHKISQLIMIQSLKHCQFDMVDNNKEEKEPIRDVFSWFYKIVTKIGHYPKPTGYKTWAEKLAEIELAVAEEQEAELRRLQEIRHKKRQIAQELAFERMMADPEGDLYQQVYARLSRLEKELGDGVAFDRAMRSRFDEMSANNT